VHRVRQFLHNVPNRIRVRRRVLQKGACPLRPYRAYGSGAVVFDVPMEFSDVKSASEFGEFDVRAGIFDNLNIGQLVKQVGLARRTDAVCKRDLEIAPYVRKLIKVGIRAAVAGAQGHVDYAVAGNRKSDVA